MADAGALSASLEDYLEAISHIVAEKHAARTKDIARRLDVNSSSVTGALHLLADRGLVNYEPYGVITLTPTGAGAAKDVIRRHETLRDFFVGILAVDESASEEAACSMEHSVSREIVDKLVRFAEFVETCPRSGDKWIQGFQHFCAHGQKRKSCEKCVALCMADFKKEQAKKKGGGGDPSALKDLKPGEKGRVAKLKARGEAGKRIAAMGVTPGALVEVERVASSGDSIDIKVRGYHVSLRKDEAAQIEVKPL